MSEPSSLYWLVAMHHFMLDAVTYAACPAEYDSEASLLMTCSSAKHLQSLQMTILTAIYFTKQMFCSAERII